MQISYSALKKSGKDCMYIQHSVDFPIPSCIQKFDGCKYVFDHVSQ